jgi:hypothetical protein
VNLLGQIRKAVSVLRRLDQRLDEIQVGQGNGLAVLNEARNSTNIQDYEFKIFSQWGEDGILQHLSRVIEISDRTFIEFGADDFAESNCRFLLVKDNWRGFIIDGSPQKIAKVRGSYYFWRHDLTAVSAFVTRENINSLLAQSGFPDDIGILSIDLDGNDYYVLDAITGFRPRILICEYNSVFGGVRNISVPYDPAFVRSRHHFSNLYWGASLGAITRAAERKGYSLVGSNSAGNNAFFVRNDLVNDRVRVLSVKDAYVESRYRESRDSEGTLSFIGGTSRLELIKGLPVYNVESGKLESL